MKFLSECGAGELFLLQEHDIYAGALIFGFFSKFSGNTIYDAILYTIFNVIFTSVPPVVYAGLERDVSIDSMMIVPEIYDMDGRRKWYMSHARFWLSLLLGILHAAIVFFVPYFAMQPFTTRNGYNIGFVEIGLVVYFCVVVIVIVRIASICSYWTYLH